MDLETAFYITGIIFMVVMLALVAILVTAVLVIKAKIDHFHKVVDTKLQSARNMADRVSAILGTVRHFVKK